MSIIQTLKEKILKLWRKLFKREKEAKFPIFYINGSQTLPPPLEPLEEEKILTKLNEENNEDAKQILAQRNLRLVVYIAKKFENTGMDLEDLISVGTIGLMKAINTFNTDKNIKLATYASRCIENEILMQLRRTTKIKTEVSIDEPLNKDGDGNELLLSDILGTDNDVTSKRIEEEVDRKLLRGAIEKLSEREKEIMELRFGVDLTGKEKTQKEVADQLRNFTKLYFKTRKENYEKNEKRHFKQNRINKKVAFLSYFLFT